MTGVRVLSRARDEAERKNKPFHPNAGARKGRTKPVRVIRRGWMLSGQLWHYLDDRRSLCERVRPLGEGIKLYDTLPEGQVCTRCEERWRNRPAVPAATPPVPRAPHGATITLPAEVTGPLVDTWRAEKLKAQAEPEQAAPQVEKQWWDVEMRADANQPFRTLVYCPTWEDAVNRRGDARRGNMPPAQVRLMRHALMSDGTKDVEQAGGIYTCMGLPMKALPTPPQPATAALAGGLQAAFEEAVRTEVEQRTAELRAELDEQARVAQSQLTVIATLQERLSAVRAALGSKSFEDKAPA